MKHTKSHRTNKLLEAMKIREHRIREQNEAQDRADAAEDVLPVIYAVFAIVLKEAWGFGILRINRLFKQTQQLWIDYDSEGYTHDEIVKDCFERTGIQLMSPKQAEKEGINPENI